MAKKSGFIAIVGAPNAGKSTLVNTLVGSKVSIVTPKPQTTRNCIKGIGVYGDCQLVFIDTPGIFSSLKSKGGQKKMHTAMISSAWKITSEADISVFVLDAKRGIKADDEKIISGLKSAKAKTVLVLNKIDLINPEKLLLLAKKLNEMLDFSATFMISAIKGSGVDKLKTYLCAEAPVAEWAYPEDEITDAPARFLAEEITREQIFLNFHQEVPHFIAVETEKWEEKGKNVINIHQVIYVVREAHKKMLIGSKGAGISEIGKRARLEMEKIFDRKINLFLFVKVNENWMRDFK